MVLNMQFENNIEYDNEWFSGIELRVLDLEQEVSDWRESRAGELAEPGSGREAGAPALGHTAASRHGGGLRRPGTSRPAAGSPGQERDPGRAPATRARPGPAAGHAWPVPQDQPRPAADRTRALIDRGRRTARRAPRRRGGRMIAMASAAGLVVLLAGAVIVFRHGPSWPPSVARVKSQIAIACQNPDVASEPGQVNFACGKDSSQILWVFALLTSHDNPGYAGRATGREGLEPITAAQGGQIAWSLNLHHPYNPLNAVDSLQVAARAINNIIGGATLTAADGNPAVQPGLESNPGNCARYTGSAAIISHPGFPGLCASPVASPAGQAALVADVYQKWMPGATPVAAQDVSVLFQNAGNPGDPQVQAILKTLPAPGR
jgi:hypothetical protein